MKSFKSYNMYQVFKNNQPFFFITFDKNCLKIIYIYNIEKSCCFKKMVTVNYSNTLYIIRLLFKNL